ncbi:Auxin Efflux Carrier family protein [Trichomonas vaginalis G3]|uniref:Auxin Efflux Carrier family protein n=1 Tax=Trichomonas vaginalis (strain ATCC PRA-98 / G3) TaxID=412133 RepID=A2FIP2_TRIV3|nr:intracellular auxin transport [Trichomonas vaginalis G3]EAX95214.1 Auxin Efflux Carrier family protein [Trichomonas vaginalis G3]KAI5506071.1 intracellular auxin transport [Trichomonas vaginalis G3]|eukprot:XP_001308144.1 Auxin Efflux Carrier family protein [Trichomonas vaginalis G3]
MCPGVIHIMDLDYGRVISVGCSILTQMIIGFIVVKTGLLKAEKIPMINRFCFLYMFFPLVLRFLAHQTVADLDFMPFGIMAAASAIAQVLLTLLMVVPFKNRFLTYVSSYFPAIYVNYVIVGLPIFTSIWPKANILIVSMITMSNDLVTAPVYLVEAAIVALMNRNKIHVEKNEPKEKFSFKIILNILKGLVTSPIILGDALGFIVAAIGKGVPTWVDRIISIDADGVLGVALFCVGGFLASHSIIACSWWKFIFCMFVKFILYPIIVAFVCWIFKLTPFLARCCTIMSTLPTASSCYMMAEAAGFGAGVSSTMIFWSMVLFIPFIIAWSAVLDALNIFVSN